MKQAFIQPFSLCILGPLPHLVAEIAVSDPASICYDEKNQTCALKAVIVVASHAHVLHSLESGIFFATIVSWPLSIEDQDKYVDVDYDAVANSPKEPSNLSRASSFDNVSHCKGNADEDGYNQPQREKLQKSCLNGGAKDVDEGANIDGPYGHDDTSDFDWDAAAALRFFLSLAQHRVYLSFN